MKLNVFIAGVFGVVGFSLSILAGLISGNNLESVLLKGTLCAIVCYAVGYVVGLIAQQVSSEHAISLAKSVAQADAAEERKDAEERAAREAEALTLGIEGQAAASTIVGKT